MLQFRALLFLLNLLSIAFAQRNITVDDLDPSIDYNAAGNWEDSLTHLSTLNVGGSHTLSEQATARATFTFTGVAVYYLAPKWPYPVNSRISIDGQTPVMVDMTDNRPEAVNVNDHETIQSAPLWSATGLSNGPHTVVVTRGDLYAIVDGFIYTVEDSTTDTTVVTVVTTTTASSPTDGDSSISSTSSSTSSPSSKQSLSTGLIVGIAVPSGILLIALIALIALCMRKKKNERVDNSRNPGPYTISASASGPATSSSAAPFLSNSSRPTSGYVAGSGTAQTIASGRTGGAMGTSSAPTSMYGYPEMGQYPNPSQVYAAAYGWQPNYQTSPPRQPQPLQNPSYGSNPKLDAGPTYAHPFASASSIQPERGLSYVHPFTPPPISQMNIETSPGRGAPDLPYVHPFTPPPTSQMNMETSPGRAPDLLYDVPAGAAGAVRAPASIAGGSADANIAGLDSYAQTPPPSFAKTEGQGPERSGTLSRPPPPYKGYGEPQ